MSEDIDKESTMDNVHLEVSKDDKVSIQIGSAEDMANL